MQLKVRELKQETISKRRQCSFSSTQKIAVTKGLFSTRLLTGLRSQRSYSCQSLSFLLTSFCRLGIYRGNSQVGQLRTSNPLPGWACIESYAFRSIALHPIAYYLMANIMLLLYTVYIIAVFNYNSSTCTQYSPCTAISS